MAVIPAKEKKAMNKLLHEISSKHWPAIPLDEIFKVVNDYGYVPLQEDNTEWSGFLLGENEHIFFDLGKKETYEYVDKELNLRQFHPKIKNCCLALSWYRFQSGNYEITVYVS